MSFFGFFLPALFTCFTCRSAFMFPPVPCCSSLLLARAYTACRFCACGGKPPARYAPAGLSLPLASLAGPSRSRSRGRLRRPEACRHPAVAPRNANQSQSLLFLPVYSLLPLFVPNLSTRSTLEGCFCGKVPGRNAAFRLFRQNLSTRSTPEGRFRGKVPEEMPLFAFSARTFPLK